MKQNGLHNVTRLMNAEGAKERRPFGLALFHGVRLYAARGTTSADCCWSRFMRILDVRDKLIVNESQR